MGCLKKLKDIKIGSPDIPLWQNIFTMICFFCFGLNFLIYYNAVVNMGDLLSDEFDYSLDFMSTYPIFLNWYNFFIAFGLVLMATFMKRFPFNFLAHFSFILYLILFVLSPIVLNYIKSDVARFWVMIIIVIIGGTPCQVNSSVFMSLAGLFSPTHNAIFLIGSSAGGIISSCLRLASGAIYKNDRKNDYFLSFYLNVIPVVITYPLYNIMYCCIPHTKRVIRQSYAKSSTTEQEEIEMHESKSGPIPDNVAAENVNSVSDENDKNELQDRKAPENANHSPHSGSDISEEEQKINNNAEDNTIKEVNSELSTEEEHDTIGKQLVRVLKTIWVELLSVTIDYFWTFCVFAGIFLGIPYDESKLELNTSLQINTFMFMIGDAVARVLYMIPIPWNRWVILACSIARCVFYVPLFIYYYNVYTNPFLMFFIMLIFSTTHGYFASHAIQLAFTHSQIKDMKMTANFCNLGLDLGLALGATGLFILNYILPDQ
ncbi:nucleoside transporter, putative [Entamoeba histolytica HM-1:IMSS-B]|uniref:Nucleoside transporter, putative n=6 Tax=Entamoeba histolytica TaxID=5759 RepID=C4LUC0_ENTH1|nr:nucleoside transporter, putative [Entamoeba histolytica HM-1:IMSS]EMD45458.1 equilibrative nucleoside transporter, putative [Entamoeba histolytica KU27]EMH75553.1 nucleoside transporter, putative [Entamoeba histolytica HM-1:IMSS-B]EMS12978.1 equilibrative nucleoside transporter, putative [Entamoeba histolytica HM-3:IMSS]ENY63667.1 equilibrative nucleoside transporter, putative [Entamoeba histolytica HM-1:IMSS-A]GAT92202.1 nucleoside transporter putative [Entamoeba histolytica]|eukprot:XP_654271.1 nucleoside transporter, putative [Entamoeba histolytica HM-1:IMSS]